MPNLTKVLQDEIRRLARKEIRAQLQATKNIVGRQRREIAELRKRLQEHQKQITFLRSQESKRLSAPRVPEKELESARFSPRSVRAHRKRLNLSAEEYARLVGVSMQTIYHWEQGKSRPRKSQLASLVAVRRLGRREARRRLEMLERTPREKGNRNAG